MKPRLKTHRFASSVRVLHGQVVVTYVVLKFRGDQLIAVEHEIRIA